MNTLKKEIILPISLKEAWYFFSRPENLNLITPEYMNFKILNKVPEQMYEGLLIVYKVQPLLRIPLTWVTKITEIKPENYFIDEQIKGPYKIWHHEHHFKELGSNKVLMSDLLYYDVGFSFIGKILEKAIIDHKVQSIFSYREKKLKEMFN